MTAVRYYDQIGLITATTRVGGKRRFDLDAVDRLRFVRPAQDVGLSLDDIRNVLDERRTDRQSLIDDKLADLIERRVALDPMIQTLIEIRQCGCDAIAQCQGIEEFVRP